MNENQEKGLKYVWHNLEYILAALCAVGMVIALFLQVVARFVFNRPIGWTEEAAVTLFVMMVYIGAIGATRNDDHLKLELFINMCSPKGRLVMLIIGDLVFFAANLVIAYGIFMVSLNLKKYGMTTSMLQIPKWIPYMVLPVCFLSMDFKLLQNVRQKVKKIRALREPESLSKTKEGD